MPSLLNINHIAVSYGSLVPSRGTVFDSGTSMVMVAEISMPAVCLWVPTQKTFSFNWSHSLRD